MERVAFTLQIKEGYEEEYDRRHLAVWPELMEEMDRSGIHRTYIYREGATAFVFMETENYRRCTEFLSLAPASRRWEEFMAPILERGAGEPYDPDQAWPSGLPEVFRWESTRTRSQMRGLTVAGTMPVSGSTWSFVGATLREAVEIYRALGIQTVDLIAVPGNPDLPQLASEQILLQPREQAHQILDLSVPVSNLNYNFAANFHERAINHIDAGIRRRNREDYGSVIEFCRACRIPSVTVLPGIVQEGWTREKALAVAAEELHHMSTMSRKAGITTTFEAHVGSILESPLDTLTFMQSNPELKLTLDYGHFICLGYAQEQVDPLVPYAAHVHLRQAAPKKLQARWDEGTLDFTGIIGKLASANYTEFLSLEYEHMEEWLDLDQADVFTETVKMRNLLRSLA